MNYQVLLEGRAQNELLISAQVAKPLGGRSVVIVAQQEETWVTRQHRPGLKPWAEKPKPTKGATAWE